MYHMLSFNTSDGFVAKSDIFHSRLYFHNNKCKSTKKVLTKSILYNISEKVNITTPQDAESKARIYYDACIDSNETIEKLAEKPLLSVIKQLGGWTILPSTMGKPNVWNLQKLTQDVQNT